MPISVARRWWWLAAQVLLAVAPLSGHAQGDERPMVRAVFQVSDSDPQKWNLTLNNVRNVQDDLGGPEATALEIVVYGPGIGMLKADSPVARRIADALSRGVTVVACENTMKAQKLGRGDMLPNISYVPAGVVELIKRQGERWAYIRP